MILGYDFCGYMRIVVVVISLVNMFFMLFIINVLIKVVGFWNKGVFDFIGL